MSLEQNASIIYLKRITDARFYRVGQPEIICFPGRKISSDPLDPTLTGWIFFATRQVISREF